MGQPKSADDLKRKVVTQIAELSKLLGMMSSDDITVQKAREAHLELSILIGKALNIPMP
jgi:hypothetical protein